MEQEKQREGVGSVIGIIIIIIVLLIGALYMAEQRIKKSKEFQASLIDASSTVISDEIYDIENDINGLGIDELGAGIDNL